MKYVGFVLLSLGLLFLASWPSYAQLSDTTRPPKKHALIIGISEYKNFDPLNTQRDVEIAQNITVDQGFDGEVIILQDTAATHVNVLAAFASLQSAAKVKKGDLVYIHYSGHGGQIPDIRDGDQDFQEEVDGYDEFLILYDTQSHEDLKPEDCPYLGGDCSGIRDDEMDDFLSILRTNLGPEGHVFIILDSCFSGTATKNPNPMSPRPRGLEWPFGNSADSGSANKEAGTMVNVTTTNGYAYDSMASLVVIAASSQQQVNSEVWDARKNAVGSLSLALERSLRKVGPNHTYSALFDLIKAEMRSLVPNQTPQIEGASSTKLFSGTYESEDPHFSPLSIEGDSTSLLIDAGFIEGLREGTEVVLCTSDTARLENCTDVLARGIVVNAESRESTVKLDRKATDALVESRVFISVLGFDTRLKILINTEESPSLSEALVSFADSMAYVDQVVAQADLVLVARRAGDGNPGRVFIYSGDRRYRVGPPIELSAEDWRDQLRYRLDAYHSNKAVREINLETGVSLELHNASQRLNNKNERVATDDKVLSFNEIERNWQIEPGGCLNFGVRNEASYGVYVTIIGLGLDGRLQEVFPPSLMPKEEFYIEGGKTKIFTPGPLYCPKVMGANNEGLIEYKLFASTNKPLDFSAIEFNPANQEQSLISRGVKKPIDIIRRKGNLTSKDIGEALEIIYTHSVFLK